DNNDDAEIIQRLLLKEIPNVKIHLAMTRDRFMKALNDIQPDLVLADNSLPQFNAREALEQIKERGLDIPFILVTGTVSDEFAASIIKSGADDYILKDRLIRLPTAIESAISFRKAQREKKQFLENLERSEKRLKQAQAIANVGDWELDLVTNIQTWSDELYRIYGLNRKEALPSTELFLSFMDPGDADMARQLLREAFDSVKESSFYFRFVRLDGLMRFGYIEWKFELDKNGTPSRFHGIIQDITELKKAEDKLKESHEEMRQLASHLQDIREEERTSMAREIHDELGQQLTVLKMDVSWLARSEGITDPEIVQKLKGLKDLIDNTVNTVRKIASALRPSLLDDLGLVPAIEWYLEDFENRSHIKTELKKDPIPEKNISITAKTGLYRIFQESLTNVARHAEATKVYAVIENKNDILVLNIADNGRGFDMSKTAGNKTLGLLGMKERVMMLGGDFTITSQPGKGTKVSVTIPLSHMIVNRGNDKPK
ncbi:MAG TPA: histidine kinase, partial [Chitinophagaceae bacterium]|nr:histidine kinase [Chitinophagaceae bacterium]